MRGQATFGVLDNEPNSIVEVQDNGPGIPDEHRTRIFERFYRVDKTRTREEGGTGLALSMVEWAVTVHRGTVEVDSKPGVGSIFRIRFPKNASSQQNPPHDTITQQTERV